MAERVETLEKRGEIEENSEELEKRYRGGRGKETHISMEQPFTDIILCIAGLTAWFLMTFQFSAELVKMFSYGFRK